MVFLHPDKNKKILVFVLLALIFFSWLVFLGLEVFFPKAPLPSSENLFSPSSSVNSASPLLVPEPPKTKGFSWWFWDIKFGLPWEEYPSWAQIDEARNLQIRREIPLYLRDWPLFWEESPLTQREKEVLFWGFHRDPTRYPLADQEMLRELGRFLRRQIHD